MSDREASRLAWGWLLFAHSKVLRALEADMTDQHDLSLLWFDLLNRLREAPEGRLRMNEFQEASVFTTSGLTRLVDRMEHAGFVRRERLAEDRRGVYVVITQEGQEKLNAVFPDHFASIEHHFSRHLTDDEIEAITSAAKKILAGDDVPDAIPYAESPEDE